MFAHRSFAKLLLASMIVVGSAMLWHPSQVVAEEAHSPATAKAGDHGGHGDSGKKASANPLVVDPDLAIYTVFVFMGLLLVLRAFAWGPIVKALDAREKTVTDHLAAAAEKHEEAKGLLAAHEARLATAKDEVREMLEEARRDAEVTKTQIVSEANTVAGAHRDRAVREIKQARDGAVRDLAETSANLAAELAGKVIQQNLSGDQQAGLVRDAIAKLTNSSPSNN